MSASAVPALGADDDGPVCAPSPSCRQCAVRGSGFSDTPMRLVLSYPGVAFTVSVEIAAAFALALTELLSLRISDVVVAYAPGSIER